MSTLRRSWMKDCMINSLMTRSALVSTSLALILAGALAPVARAADKVPSKPAAHTQHAQAPLVQVDSSWIRSTVKGQMATGGFMSLTASQSLTLIGFSTLAAGESELHEMDMDGGVMRMRAIESLALPAGKAVTLRPGAGGQHLMLMGLKQPLKEGDEVQLTLRLRTADGQNLTQDIKVPVRAQKP